MRDTLHCNEEVLRDVQAHRAGVNRFLDRSYVPPGAVVGVTI